MRDCAGDVSLVVSPYEEGVLNCLHELSKAANIPGVVAATARQGLVVFPDLLVALGACFLRLLLHVVNEGRRKNSIVVVRLILGFLIFDRVDAIALLFCGEGSARRENEQGQNAKQTHHTVTCKCSRHRRGSSISML